MRCDACLSSSNKQSQTKARRARPCIVSVYKYTRRPAIRNAGAKAINLCAATGQRACEWLLGCLRCVAVQRTLTDGEESKMEAYAAGAKFDCLLFGEERTKIINNPPHQPSCMDCCSPAPFVCLLVVLAILLLKEKKMHLALHAQTWTTLCTR
jgi:hypothetical protein